MTSTWIIAMLALSAVMCWRTEAVPICPPLGRCKPCGYPNVPAPPNPSGCPACMCRNPCEKFRCPKGKKCKVNFLSGKPSCVCPSICFPVYAPVCGSDRKTYSNSCQLGIYNCWYNKKVTKVMDGPCRWIPWKH